MSCDNLLPPETITPVLEEFAAERIGYARVARIVGVPAYHLRLARLGRGVPAETVDAIRNAIRSGLLVKPSEEPIDEITLELLLSGQRVTIPAFGKPVYARELYARGWNRNRISKALHASFGKVDLWTQEAACPSR